MKKKIFGVLFIFLLAVGAFSPLTAPKASADWTDYIGVFGLTSKIGKALGADQIDNPCNPLHPKSSIEACINKGVAWIAYMLIALASLALWCFGVLFNFSIYISLSIKKLVDNTDGIIAAWRVIRDMCNIFFIFMVLMMAIRTIIGVGDFKKPLATLITAALFINFSFFLTGVVIDASNIVAIGFYDAIMQGGYKGVTGTTNLDGGISNLIRRKLDVVSIYDSIKAQKESAEPNGNAAANTPGATAAATNATIALAIGANSFFRTILISMWGIVVITIICMIFLYASILFFMRTIALIVLLATSPFAFVGNVLPQLGGQTSEWWTSLWNQSFFAPFYLMILYVAFKLIDKLNFANFGVTNKQGSLAEFFLHPSLDNLSVVLNFILIIGFLLATFKVADHFKIKSADFAKKVAGAATVGAAAYLGQRSVGRLANRIAETDTVKNFAANNKIIGGTALRSLRGVAGSTFDLRNVNGLDPLGKGGKDGFKQSLDANSKREVEFAKSLGKPEGAEDAREKAEKRETEIKKGKGALFEEAKQKRLDGKAIRRDSDGNILYNQRGEVLYVDLTADKARNAALKAQLATVKAENDAAKAAQIELVKLEADKAKADKEEDANFDHAGIDRKIADARAKMAKGGREDELERLQKEVTQFDEEISNAVKKDAEGLVKDAKEYENTRQSDYALENENNIPNRIATTVRSGALGATKLTTKAVGKVLPGFAKAVNSGATTIINQVIVAPREGSEAAKAIRKEIKGKNKTGKQLLEEATKKLGEEEAKPAPEAGGGGIADAGGIPKKP